MADPGREDNVERQAVFSLHRYFIASNRMRTHFDELIAKRIEARAEENASTDQLIEERLYLGLWYAGLYVVIEGWRRPEAQ